MYTYFSTSQNKNNKLIIFFLILLFKKNEGCGEQEVNLGLLLDVMLGTELRSFRKKMQHILKLMSHLSKPRR